MARGSVNVPASIEKRRVVLESRFEAAVDDYLFPAVTLSGLTAVFAFGSGPPPWELSPGTLLLLLVVFALPIYWIYASYRSYRLTRFDVLGSQEVLRERVLDAVEELNWVVVKDRKDIVIAHTRSGLVTAGQIMTVVPVPNALYIGCRNRAGPKGRSPFSFGRHAENIAMLRAAMAPDRSIGQALEP